MKGKETHSAGICDETQKKAVYGNNGNVWRMLFPAEALRN